MKKPFLYALVAAIYIVFIVSFINFMISMMPQKSVFIPMVMLSLFVLSAAIMGFLFLYEPLDLYIEGRKGEAVVFFLRIVGFFACFAVVFLAALFLF